MCVDQERGAWAVLMAFIEVVMDEVVTVMRAAVTVYATMHSIIAIT
jgi:hypothetical protein